MGKRDNNDDKRLLIAGLLLLFTGAFSGVGVVFLVVFGLKKFIKHRYEIEKLFEDNMQETLKNKYKSTYDNSSNTDNSTAKVIYAEKVETVVENKKEESKIEPKVENTKNNESEEFSSQDILNKLEYYSAYTDMTDEQIIEKITTLNKMLISLVPKLDKPELQDDVTEISKIIDKILKTLKKKKSKIKKINNFTTYYLPVTLKILIKYDEVENLKLNTENSKEFMNTVEEKIKMIKASFKKQLESLYIEDFDDVEAELDVLETMLKSDGYTDLDDFNLRGKSNN